LGGSKELKTNQCPRLIAAMEYKSPFQITSMGLNLVSREPHEKTPLLFQEGLITCQPPITPKTRGKNTHLSSHNPQL